MAAAAAPTRLSTVEQVKQTVKSYYDIGVALDQANVSIASLKKRRSELGQLIFQYMQQTDTPAINLPDGTTLVLERKRSRAAISPDHVASKLESYFGEDSEQVKQLMQSIYKDRPVKYSEKLTRRKARKNNSKSSKYLQEGGSEGEESE